MTLRRGHFHGIPHGTDTAAPVPPSFNEEGAGIPFGIVLTPDTVTISADDFGTPVQLSAVVVDVNGDPVPDVEIESWSMEPQDVGSIDQEGLITFTGVSSPIGAVAFAIYQDINSNPCVVHVNPGVAVSIEISPEGPLLLLALDPPQQFTVVCLDAQGNNAPVVWSAGDVVLGTIDQNGLYTLTGAANEDGDNVTVSSDDEATLQALCNLFVSPSVFDSIVIAPTTLALQEGETDQLSADVLDAHGNLIQHNVGAWLSDQEEVATVDVNNGLVEWVGNGTAHVTATIDGDPDEITSNVCTVTCT